MTSRLMSTVAVVALLCGLAGTSTGRAAASNDSDLARAVQFREEFGLTADLASVENIERNDAVNRDYGVALTEAERAELTRREYISEGLQPIEDYLTRIQTSMAASISTTRREASLSCS